MAGRIILPVNPSLDANGASASGSTLTCYENGTTVLQSIYSSAALDTPLPNPLTCDAAGRFPEIWAQSGSVYSVKWSIPGASAITFDDIVPLGVGDAPFVNAADFGASPSASAADNSAAFAEALATGNSVWIGPGVYDIDQTFRIFADGQSVIGAGGGHVNVPSVLTTLRYTGTAGSPALSFYNGTKVVQSAIVSDLNVDGNDLANYAVEGYKDTFPAGAWNNKVERSHVFSATDTALYLGSGSAPAFANDYAFNSLVISDSPIGVKGACGPVNFAGGTMIFNCSTVALSALAGSVFEMGDTKFSTNKQDILMGNNAQVTGHGNWFENSTDRICGCTTAAHLSLTGGRFHTSGSNLFNLGGAAGEFTINGAVASDSNSGAITGINATANRNFLGSTGLSPSDGIYLANVGGGIIGLNKLLSASNATLVNGGTLSLTLSRGTYPLALAAYDPSDGTRGQNKFGVLTLFDGSGEAYTSLSDVARGSGLSITVAANNNAVLITNGSGITIALSIGTFGLTAAS